MKIGDVCQREVVTVDKSTPIPETARVMRAEHVGDVIIVDAHGGQKRPIGIITDRDLVVELLAKDADIGAVTAGDLSNPRMVTAQADANLFETIRLMSVKGVRRVPVLDVNGDLFGILSLEDILAVLIKELGYLRDLSVRRNQRETSIRD